MAAFDALPRAVRARLAASRFDFKAASIAADRRAFHLNAAETVAFIAALEAWAAEAEHDAEAVTNCNRLTPRRFPCAAEIVDEIRSQTGSAV